MKKLLMAIMILAAAVMAHADTDGYVMFAVYSPGQIPISSTYIDGVRISLLYGECQGLNGFDIGLVNRVRENMNGLQISGVNSIGTDANGFQVGLWNSVESEFSGFQLGLWNDVGSVTRGFQLGIVNTTTELRGLQIGIVNFIDKPNPSCRCLPIVNFGW